MMMMMLLMMMINICSFSFNNIARFFHIKLFISAAILFSTTHKLTCITKIINQTTHRPHLRVKGCLHYDTCTPYMYVVQVYGVHVS